MSTPGISDDGGNLDHHWQTIGSTPPTKGAYAHTPLLTSSSSSLTKQINIKSEEGDDGSSGGGGGNEKEEDPFNNDDDDVNVPNTSLVKSAFHIFKGNVGPCIFLLPTIYNDSGYIVGPIIAVGCGLMVIDSTMMLLRAKKKINHVNVQSYPQVVSYVFGNVFRLLTNFAIVATQLGYCTMYLQFAAGLLESIHPFPNAYRIWVAIVLFLAFPMTLFSNNMSLLAVASAIGCCCVLFSVFGTLGETSYTVIDDGVATDKIEAMITPARWVLYIASCMSTMEGIALVLPVENACKNKDKFAPMVKTVLAGIVCLYVVYGMMGYLAYGSSISVSVVTILSLNPFTIAIRLALALNLLLTYPLQYVPAIQIIDNALRVDNHRHGLKSPKAIVVRIVTNAVMGSLAVLIGADTVGLILAYIGSIAATMLAIILPSMLELQTDLILENKDESVEWSRWTHIKKLFSPPASSSRFTFTRVRCYLYIVLGVATMIIGTVTCLFQTYSLLHHKNGKSIEHLRHEQQYNTNTTSFMH